MRGELPDMRLVTEPDLAESCSRAEVSVRAAWASADCDACTIPEVSVVTPAFNPGSDTERTVRSIQAQTMKAFEWIVIDDGSNEDEHRLLLQQIQKASVRSRVLRHSQNAGPGAARNSGFRYSRARHVLFLDMGDELQRLHIASLVTAARELKGLMALPFAPTTHIYESSGRQLRNNSFATVADCPVAQLSRFLYAPFVSHCGVLFPRSLIEDLGGYDPELVTDEDGDLLISVLLNGWRFRAVPQISYRYWHPSSRQRVSVDDSTVKIAARRRVCEKLMAHYATRRQPMPEDVRIALCKRIDALAVRSADTPGQVKDLLALASSLKSNYSWSGHVSERTIRMIFGLRTANYTMKWVRARRAAGQF